MLTLLVLVSKWLCNSSKSHILTHTCFSPNSLLWSPIPPDIFQITLLSSHPANLHSGHHITPVHSWQLMNFGDCTRGLHLSQLLRWNDIEDHFFFLRTTFWSDLSYRIYWVLYVCRGETVPFTSLLSPPYTITVELRTMSCSYHFWMSFLITF